jgi:dethiobiotin synthetase
VPSFKSKIIVVTGTDTGVGKTVLTALLLHHLRIRDINALAIKPFCSGGRGDIRLLRAVQNHVLTEQEITPYFFPEPLTPWLAAQMAGRTIPLSDVVQHIRDAAKKCDVLLVEGAGGILAPLGERFSLLDVIGALRCAVVIVARNRLGTLNHTLLTVRALQKVSSFPCSIVLMGHRSKDPSSGLNSQALQRLLPELPVCSIPFLGRKIRTRARIAESEKKIKKSLAAVLGSG